MLTPKPVAIFVAALLSVLATIGSAAAEPGGSGSVSVDQNANNDSADLTATTGATDTNPGSSSGAGTQQAGSRSPRERTCTHLGDPIDCTNEAGVWSQDMQCWVQRLSPQPSADYPGWAGHTDGAIYMCYHPGGGGMNDYDFWAPNAGTAGAPVLVDPVTLAEEAIDSANLRAIDIGITPPPGPDSRTLVGIPTWMWVDEPVARTWGPITLSPSAGPVTVTVTGKVKRVVWDMGDGTTVNCTKGTPYQVAYDADPSPTCGHQYKAPGTYTVTATSDWEFDWAGAGQSGTIEFSLTRDTTVNVAEAFALVTEQG